MKNTNFSAEVGFEYQAASDLGPMGIATNYQAWVVSFLATYLKNRTILEVGAGTGNFAAAILKTGLIKINQLYLMEPSENLHAEIKTNLKSFGFKPSHLLTGFLPDQLQQLQSLNLDCVIYNNVFEHIDNDRQEIKSLARLLKPGGLVLSFTPALPGLYSQFDWQLGHYRRYILDDLASKFVEAGFKINQARYVDFWGALIWWLQFKVLKITRLIPSLLRLYDGILFRVLAQLDISNFMRFGKNILIVAEK